MKKLAILLLAAALLAGMLSVCSAVTLSFGDKEIDAEEPWYELTDGLLTIFLTNEDGEWEYAGETSMGGTVKQLTSETRDGVFNASFEGDQDGKSMMTFNLKGDNELKQVNVLFATIEGGVITYIEHQQMSPELAASMENLKLPDQVG